MIAFLGKYSETQAESWALQWLRSHVGLGSCLGDPAEETDSPASALAAEEALSRLVEIADSPYVQRYVSETRRIDAPYPDCIKALPYARGGEDALVGILTARGRTVGLELTYIDSTGQKSTITPQRRTLKLERLPDAVFDIPSPGESTDVEIAEGLPDTLTVFRWGKCRCRIIGLPGIGALKSLRFTKGTKITVVAHGDASDSQAAKDLQDGLDKQIIDGCDVHVTATPPNGEDANSIFLKAGFDGLQTFLGSAEPAKVSLNGEIEKLARLSELDYAQVRRAKATDFGIPVKVLDDEVRKHRAANKSAPPDWEEVSTDDLQHEEVDLAHTLDGILKELKRYVVASEEAFTTMALWCAHSHLVHHPLIQLTISPRLAIQAADYDSGKSVTLEAVGCLVPNPAPTGSISPAYLEHALAFEKLTLLINEAHLVLHKNSDPRLRRIFNCSHRRREAIGRTLVQTPSGAWEPVEFDVWCTMCWASVGELPRDAQSRAVVVNLPKALGVDVPEHLRDGTSPELEHLHTELVVWAAGLQELEDNPLMPEVLQRQHGRVGDNWRPLLAVADLAGPEWSERARGAALAAISAERVLTPLQRILRSVRRAFGDLAEIETGVLLRKLIDDADEEWDRANRGRPITAYWLRDNLKGLLKPPGIRRWRDKKDKERICHGYYRKQFEEAWRTHLAGIKDVEEEEVESHSPEGVSLKTSSTSGTPGTGVDKRGFFDEVSGTPSGSSGTPGNGLDKEGFFSEGATVPPANGSFGPDQATKKINEINGVSDVSDAVPDAGHEITNKFNAVRDAPDVPDGKREGIGREANGSVPNAADHAPIRPKRRRLILADDIKAFAEANPKLTAEQIAKKFGVPRVRVEKILGSGPYG
jgi:putative DNA primase/helicase